MEYNIEQFLGKWVEATAKKIEDFGDGFNAEMRPADPRFGDYQANGILPYAKRLGKNPRELAQILSSKLLKTPEVTSGEVEVEIAGPGFLNFKINPKKALQWLLSFDSKLTLEEASIKTSPCKGKTIVIDYSSPNTAKQMHVGHLRSMIIGEAIQRMLRFCGANIIRDNHLGDWGTQFGILIMAIKRAKYDLDSQHEDPIEDLERLYKEGSKLFKEEDTAKEEARRELVKLQQGDPENMKLWQKISEVSWKSFDEIYKQMGVSFDQIQGESFYRDQVDRVYKELAESAIAVESEGALVVFHPEHARFKEFPFIIRKADGASNYGTTDLATALHHVEVAKADELIYVTDGRQQDHFQQLFMTVEKWFKAKGYKLPSMHHAWFGMVLGEDGKAIKTRSGDPIKLKDLLHEARERAFVIVTEKNPSLPEEERRHIAKVVGLGAVKYADLSQNRTSDYVFNWDKLLAFEGNTAPYLLYAVARIRSIFAKAGISVQNIDKHVAELTTPEEIKLAKKIMAFPVALDQALVELKPHFLCAYLYELAGDFSSFYKANRVVGEEARVQALRLTLCAKTQMILELGLHLLGIETLERM